MLYSHPNGIEFRRVMFQDLIDLAALKNESWWGTHRISFVSADSQKRWLTALDAEDVTAPKNLVLIAGDCGVFKVLNIDWQNRLASVGWDVYPDRRRHGLGKKIVAAGVAFCFDVLNLHHLQADILASNIASQKCAEAAGFVRQGVQPYLVRKNGKWVDNLIYGILESEDRS